MLGLVLLHLQRAFAHPCVLGHSCQMREKVARALLVMQGDLQGVIRLHQVMQFGRVRGLGPFHTFPAHLDRSHGRLLPAHLLQDLVGVALLDARELAEQLGHLAVVVHFHGIGELRVALRRFHLHRIGMRHEVGRAGDRRALPRRLGGSAFRRLRRLGNGALRRLCPLRRDNGLGLAGACLGYFFRALLHALFRTHSANSASRSDGRFLLLPTGG